MREIKFRGKRIYPVGWVYGDLIQFFSGRVDISDKSDYVRTWNYTVDPATVGQFTGLHDKAGREIYEKDYAEKNGIIYLVLWDNNKYILKDISSGDIIELDNNIKVRSNYYENTEEFTGKYCCVQENA